MRLAFLLILTLLHVTSFGQTIEKAKLDSLVQKAKASNSDGLIVIQNGKVLVEEYFNQPLTPTYIASVSKALVSIAIIKLLNDGKIKSIDQPVADFYPEWKQGQKRFITLRMLLSHTSGMQNERNSRLEIETGPKGAGDDLVKLALAAEITDKPGTVYSYNNKGTCLLPGIILQASGKRMDKYFEEEFFKPMGITKFEWKADNAGTPQGHGGFRLLPRDLAKFGQLMLDKGVYDGKRYFEERWVDSSIAPSQQINQQIGLIWHRFFQKSGIISFNSEQLQKLQDAGVTDSILLKLKSLAGKIFRGDMEIIRELEKLFGPAWMSTVDSATKVLPNGTKDLFKISSVTEQLKGYYHTGSWGQYLIIIPEHKLVVVRMVKRDKKYVEEIDSLGGFVSYVFLLVK